MLWIFLALLGAITNAGYFIIIKRYITTLDPNVLTGIGFTCGGSSYLPSRNPGNSAHRSGFLFSGSVTAILNIIGLSLIFKALSSIGSLPVHSHALVHTGNLTGNFLYPPTRSPLIVRVCWESASL